jgi:2-keto-3-deoxy-galactonokinase
MGDLGNDEVTTATRESMIKPMQVVDLPRGTEARLSGLLSSTSASVGGRVSRHLYIITGGHHKYVSIAENK